MWVYTNTNYFELCNYNVMNMSFTAKEFEKLLLVNYQNITFGGFQDTSFAFAEIFTYLYGVSAYCQLATVEVQENSKTRFSVLSKNPIYIVRNFVKWIGTILSNLMLFPNCFYRGVLDG